MKNRIIYYFIFIAFSSVAQPNKNSIIKKLKNHPKQDTTRCFLLNKLIEEEQDHNIWIKYNNELKKITLLQANTKQDSLYKTYLKYLSIAINNDGTYAIYNDQYDAAIKNYKKALQLSSKIKYHEGNALSLQNIGTTFDFIGKLDSSLFYHKKAHVEALLSKKQDVIAYVLTDLGYVYNNIGNSSLAIKHNIQALKIFETIQDESGKERTTFAIGRIFDSQNDYKKSLVYYQECLKINTQIKDEQRQVLLLNSIAHVYINIKNYPLAKEYIEKAILLGKKSNNKSGLASSYKFYGDFYLNANNLDKANSYYQQAADIYKDIQSQNFYAKVLIQLAKINLKKQNLALAKQQAFTSLKISKESSFPNENKNAAEVISQIYNQEKNYKKAYEFKTIAAKIADSIYFDEAKDIALKAEFKYDTEKKETQIKDLHQESKIAKLESERQKNIVIALIVFLILISVIAYFLFNRFKTKKQNELLKIQLEEAEKTIEAEKKAAESELKALKSQMNPHFIFNALNSIQEQFMFGNKEVANEQMGNFTYLTRQILNVSGKKKIPVATEIEILTKYLELEKMRFHKDFEYKIHLDENIDDYYTQIPPMLIQPFVENSIKHGLLHREGSKEVSIDFIMNETESAIICTIVDNGIGREKSAKIKARNDVKHESFSTQSIDQRLEIWNDGLANAVVYEDILNLENEINGTKVVLTIAIH